MKTKLITILLISVFTGCVSASSDTPWINDNTPSIQPYQIEAIKYEKNDELQLALANWRIAEKLLITKIDAISSHIENNAEMHFQKGVTLYNSGISENAKIEFLKALRYDREHKGALSYLENWYQTSGTIEYTVKSGDTFQKIADTIYDNHNSDYIVKYFLAQDSDRGLRPGTTIKLPVLNIKLTKKFFNYKKEIQTARRLFHKKKYEDLLIVAENIIKHAPENKEAVFMINTANYKLGETYLQAGKYKRAIEFFQRVDPGFRNVKDDIAKVHFAHNARINEAAKLKNEATKFENEKFYYKGLELYRKKYYLEAFKHLNKVSPDYENVTEVKLKIEAGMKKESDLHYKNGVKHFVNENLTLAIKEWKKALILNPESQMIERDIENAMNLLEKIKKID